jgi:hypothetical protein
MVYTSYQVSEMRVAGLNDDDDDDDDEDADDK